MITCYGMTQYNITLYHIIRSTIDYIVLRVQPAPFHPCCTAWCTCDARIIIVIILIIIIIIIIKINMCICMYICTHIHTYVYVCICTYIYIYMYIHTCLSAAAGPCEAALDTLTKHILLIYVDEYVYIYIYTYIHIIILYVYIISVSMRQGVTNTSVARTSAVHLCGSPSDSDKEQASF